MFTKNMSCKLMISRDFNNETNPRMFTNLSRIVFFLFIVLETVICVATAEVCGGIRNRFICDDQDPSVFHICLGNNQYTMVCPGKLHFNSRTQNCDWPDSVNCVNEALSRQPYSNANTVPTLSPTSRPKQLPSTRKVKDSTRTRVLPTSTSAPRITTSEVSSVVHTINASKVLTPETASTEVPHSRYRLKVVPSTVKPLESLLPADEKVIEEVKKLSEELKHIDNYLKSLEPEEVGFMIEPYMAAFPQKRSPYSQRYPKLESKKYTQSPFNIYRKNSTASSPFSKTTSSSPYRINTATYYRSKSTNNPRTHRVSRMASTTRRTDSPFRPTQTLFRSYYVPAAYRPNNSLVPASSYSYRFSMNGLRNNSVGHIRNPYKDPEIVPEAYKFHGSKYNLQSNNKQYAVYFDKTEHRFGDRSTSRLTQRTHTPHYSTTKSSSTNSSYRNQRSHKPQTTRRSQMPSVGKTTLRPQMSSSAKSSPRSQWLTYNGTARRSQMPFAIKPDHYFKVSDGKTTRKFQPQNDIKIRIQSVESASIYKQPSIYRSTPTQPRKLPSHFSQARDSSNNNQNTSPPARGGSTNRHSTLTRTRDGQINKYTTSSKARDGPINRHTTSTQARDSPINRHTTSTQARDSPINRHTTSTQTIGGPVHRHTTSVKARDGPINRHTTSVKARDSPINRHTTSTQARGGPVHRHNTPNQARDDLINRHTTSNQAKDGHVNRHSTLTSKEHSSNQAWWSTRPSSSSGSTASQRMSSTTTRTSSKPYSEKTGTSKKPVSRNMYGSAKSSTTAAVSNPWWSTTKLEPASASYQDKSPQGSSGKHTQIHYPPRPNYKTRTPNFDVIPAPGNERSTLYRSNVGQNEHKDRPINAPAAVERSFTLHSAPRGDQRSFSLYQVNAAASADRFALHKPNANLVIQSEKLFPLYKPHLGSGNREMVIQTEQIVPLDKYEEEQESKAISAYKSPVEKYEMKKGKCSSSWCKLPDCRCIGSDIPGGFDVTEVPQMVMLTFDDSINSQNMHYFRGIFNGTINNPNGCPIKSTFFVSGDSSDYDMVKRIYKQGHEIASHTMSHRSPTTWWARAGYENWEHEIVGMRNRLNEKSGVPVKEITGMRAPFLQVGGDAQYAMLKENKFRYDSSMVTGNLYTNKQKPIWPFTLDTPPDSTTCSLTPCPTRSYPGLWEVPLIRWYGSNRVACAMPDACTIGLGTQGTLKFMEDNFNRHYTTNRAPLGIFIHASWFGRKDGNFQGLIEFLRSLADKEDVWVVTVSQALDWVQHPVRLSALNALQSWAC